MKTRPVRPEDASQIAGLCAQVMPNPWSQEAVENEIAQGRQKSLVVVDDRQGVVAFVFLRPVGDEYELTNISVAPGLQGRGLGRMLLNEAVKALGLPAVVYLEVSALNQAAQGLYGALGFLEIGRRKGYYRDGSDAVNMKLVLAKA
jgi:ribosomal-protein-alanine N-acetyltransferase